MMDSGSKSWEFSTEGSDSLLCTKIPPTFKMPTALAPEPTNPLDDPKFLAKVARRRDRCMTDVEFRAWKLAQTDATVGPPMAWLPITPHVSVLANLTPVRFDTPATDDGPRPSFDFGHVPTLDAELEAVALLNSGPDDDHDDLDWHQFQAERMESAFAVDVWDTISPDELIECRGHHPATPYDV